MRINSLGVLRKVEVSNAETERRLVEAHLKEAEETLKTMLVTKGKWKVITGYYASYHALYAVLGRCGIKCEIHDCTISLMSLLGFSKEEEIFLRKLKEDRIQAQYHLKNRTLENEQTVKTFIKRCKRLLQELDNKTIDTIQQNLRYVKTFK